MTFLILIIVAVLLIPPTLRQLNKAWNATPSGSYPRQVGIFAAAALSVCSPYLVWKTYDVITLFARVPKPLRSLWVDYRVEDSWGIGGPGDNETGFIVYHLTPDSTAWAKSQGATLGANLDAKDGEWLPTPIDDTLPERGWHDGYDDRNRPPHPADLAEYLVQYGFGIAVDKNWLAQANRAIRNPGSFYRYGQGGRVTIVAPAAGKIYVAYAG